MDLSVHTATLSHQCSKSEFFRVRLFCLYWNLKPIWICGSFELRFLKQDVVSNIVWNGLSKPAFILVCNFAIFREITFLVLLLKGACLPSRNMHNIPKEVGRHLPPSTVLGRLCCLTFYLCLTIKSATPWLQKFLDQLWLWSWSQGSLAFTTCVVLMVSADIWWRFEHQGAWSNLYLRPSVPLLLLSERWSEASAGALCAVITAKVIVQKDVSTALQHSLSPATRVSSPCKFWGQGHFRRWPVRTRCKRGY